MIIKTSIAFFCGILIIGCTASANADSLSDYAERVNRWGERQKGKTYEIQKPGEFQKPGELQKAPGEFQKPGKFQEITIPKGQDAIKEKQDDGGCNHRITVSADTLFEFDQATLTPDAEAALKLVGPKLQALSSHPIIIEGHTDSKGTDLYNQKLSERRAERVRNWFLQNHYISTMVPINGYGEKRPVAANENANGTDNPKGRQLNRRVEIVVDTCKTVDANSDLNFGGGSGSSTTAIASTGSTSQTSGSGMTIVEGPMGSTPAGAGQASEAVARNNELLPFVNLASPDEIKSGFANIRITPLDNKDLYFEVLNPNDWVSRPLKVSPQQVAADRETQVPLADLGPPGIADVSTEVRYMRVNPSVTAEEFLLTYAKKSGFDIVVRQHAEFNDRKVEDALLRINTPKGAYNTRLTVARRGDYAFMIASSAPASDYDKWKRVFGIAAVSFNPSGK